MTSGTGSSLVPLNDAGTLNKASTSSAKVLGSFTYTFNYFWKSDKGVKGAKFRLVPVPYAPGSNKL